MQITPIKTRIALPPQDDIYELINASELQLQEKDIIAITTKVLAIHQGRTIPVSEVSDRDELIMQEAERFLPRDRVPGQYAIIAIKNNALLPSAGIDESNGKGYYILLPKNINALLQEIHGYLKDKFGLKEIGLIATDSHTIPFHYGTLGIALGAYGFEMLYDYRGNLDLFNRPLKITQKNIVDGLAAAAVIVMGEGAESTPFAVIRGAPGIEFSEQAQYEQLIIPPDEDIYSSLFSNFQKS